MGAHQQKFLHQHKLQKNANIMYENLFPTTKINFLDFHGGGAGISKETGLLKKIPMFRGGSILNQIFQRE